MRGTELRFTRTVGQLLSALGRALEFYIAEYGGWRQLDIVHGDFTTNYEGTRRSGYRVQGVALSLHGRSRKFSLLCFSSKPEELNVAREYERTYFTFYVEGEWVLRSGRTYPVTVGIAKEVGVLIDAGTSFQELPEGPRV